LTLELKLNTSFLVNDPIYFIEEHIGDNKCSVFTKLSKLYSGSCTKKKGRVLEGRDITAIENKY